jgi:hypothetical protein
VRRDDTAFAHPPYRDAALDRYISATTNAQGRRAGLPKISEFFGIAIYIYWREHPPPHFHAIYAGDEVIISIDDLSVLDGKVNPRALGLIIEWVTLHQGELRDLWADAEALKPLGKIEPLK